MTEDLPVGTDARPLLRAGVLRADLSDETLLVDPDTGLLLRLTGRSRAMLDATGDGGVQLRDRLGLDPHGPAASRRDVLAAAAALAALGVTATVLPTAASAASPAPGPTSYSDGAVDLTFDMNLSLFTAVPAVLALPDDQLMVGGTFGSVDGEYYNNVAIIDENGDVATGFAGYLDRGIDGEGVLALARSGSTNYVGGDIRDIVDRTDPEMWEYEQVSFPLVTLSAAGDVATVTSSAFGGTVTALAVDGSGRLLVAGSFDEVGGESRRNLVRLDPGGTVDTTFDANVDATLGSATTLHAVAVQSDGRILIGGELYDVGGVDRYGAARLLANGDLDPTFDPNTTYENVYAITEDSSDGILIGGSFQNVAGETVDRVAIARFHRNGVLDTDFDANLDEGEFPEVRAITVQPDGRILIGGTFTSVDGATRRNLARLLANGDLDSSFGDANVALLSEGTVRVDAILVDGDGRVVIGGSFTHVGGVTRRSIARLAVTPAD